MAGKKENEISNRISFALYVVTAFNCVFMLVSVACLCWNVNIHREISRIDFGFDPVIPSRHQGRHVRSLLEPGSKEDLEFRKKEERRFSILGRGQESDNSDEPSHQATCSECKRICTLIFYHQPSKVTNSSENKEKICGGTLFDKSTVERFVGDFVEKRYGSVLQQFRLAHANGRNPRCPRFPFQDVKCSENIEHECLDSLDCDSGKICCSDGCEKICVQPNPPRNDTKIYTGDNNFSPSGENVCPKSQRLDNCPQVEHECTDDTDCLDGEKCCLDGCARICLAPAVVKKKTAEDKNQTLNIFVKSYIKKYIEPFTSKYNSTLEKYQKQLKAFDKSAVRKMVDSQMAGYVEPLQANISKVRRTLEDRYMEKKEVHTFVEYSVDGAVKSFDSKLNRRLNGLPKPVSKDDIKKIVDDYAKRFYAAEVPSGTTNDNKTTEETVSTLLRKYFGPLPSLQPVCPTPQPIGTCSAVRNHECNDDAGCSGGKKCCFNGCDRYCATPVPPTAFPLRNLAQPIQNSTLQTIVQSYVNQYLGPLPSFNASGQAPLRTSIEEVVNNQLTHYIGPLQPFNSSIQTPFSDFSNASIGNIADTQIEKYLGPLQPFNSSIQMPFGDFSNASIGNIADTQIEKYLGPLPQLVCPSFPRAGECPAKKVHECDDDFNCTGQQKCCLDGCDRKCVEPVQALYSFASALGPVNINSTVQQQVGTFIGEYLGGDIRNFNSTVRGLVEGYTAEFLSKANVSGISVGGGTLTSKDVKQIVLEQNRIIFGDDPANFNVTVKRLVKGHTSEFLGGDIRNFNSTVRGLVEGYTAEFLSKANVSGTSVGGGTLTSEDVKQIVLEQNRIIFGDDPANFNVTVKRLVKEHTSEVSANQATQGCIACTNASVQRRVEFYTRSFLRSDEGLFNSTVQKLVNNYLVATFGKDASARINEATIQEEVRTMLRIPKPRCPSRKIDPANCPQEKDDRCATDNNCPQGLKCCIEFCDKACVRPIEAPIPPLRDNATLIAIINSTLQQITLPPGPPGPPGIKGSGGIPGLHGFNGSVGPVGPQGAQGPQGPQGPVGPEGPKGDKGDQGDPGKDGRDGRDATTPDLKAVPGPPGPPGRDGREGKDGQRGPRGSRGFRGFKGQKGEPGKVPKTKEKPDLFAGFVKPNITRYPNTTVVIKEGESLNMICDAIGVPLPEVYWVKQGTQQSRIGGKFSLNPAKREDTGKWQCVAKNVLGVETAPMDLTVYTKPVFRVEPPLQFTAYENRDSKFECEASGTPKPKIEWKRSGDRPLPKDGRHIVSGTTLILRNPRRVDSDIYVCQASNAGGTSVAAVDVIVNKFDPVEVIQVPPRSQRLRQIGETLIANCSAKGEPSPNITWYKNGVRVPSKERLINDEVFSQLHVQSFKAKDQGLYECRITSEFKKAPISNFMHVDLPKCRDPGRPKDGQRAGDEFFSGSVVKFSCNPGCFLHGSAIRICRPDGRWSGTQPICYYVGPVVAYECQHYKLLTEANRNQNYRRFLGNCDEKLAEGWYRFASGAGMQMATKCLPMNRCDSRLPGWFWGRLPSKKEGCITANVCFGTHRGGCCQRKRKILVRNCGKFYVYKLGPSPLCPARYCGE